MPVQVAEHQVAIDMAEERDIAPSDSTSRPDSRDSTKRENALSRENAINYLLEICAHNNITVTEDLRRAILGEEMNSEVENKVSRRPKYDTRQSLLGGLVRSHQEEHLLEDESELIRDLRSKLERLRRHDAPFEVRIKDGSFKVKTPVEPSGKAGRQHIATVANAGCVYRLRQAARRLLATGSCKQGVEEKHIMEGVNLVLEGGKMYLVLGAPGCGKSTLLKMVADRLPEDSKHIVGGSVEVNGINRKDDTVWSNIVCYVDQIDRLHGFLTVKETFEFAFQCCYGGTHSGPFLIEENDPDVKKLVKEMDDEQYLVNLIMKAIGLESVENTFVGNDKVRGVSGGQKKRVTVGEMMAARTFVDCFDEISTGLDAATTFDICKIMGKITRLRRTVRLVSLLQPSPETVALFDEIILLDKGRILYAGPVDAVTTHFQSLGYEKPPRMDTADWLQSLPTNDGAKFLADQGSVHLTNTQFVEKYNDTERGQVMLQKLSLPLPKEKDLSPFYTKFKMRYANSTLRSIKIVCAREFLLWRRDKYARKARLIQCVFIGVINGTVFYQVSDPLSVIGVVFQSVLFISLGAMLKIGQQIDTRAIFYKEQDANFYPTWTFVLGRSLAGLPSSLQDSLVYGSLIYWFVGLAPSAGCFFVYLILIQLSAFTFGLMFSIFSATIKDRPSAQAAMSISLVVLILFSGFTVSPDVIPSYYIWIYWSNLLAWILRALLINEFQSGFYDEVVNDDGETQGENTLIFLGYQLGGEAFEYVWVWYTVLFCICICLFSMAASTWYLVRVRFATGGSLGGSEALGDLASISNSAVSSLLTGSLEAKGATLTFENVNYFVKASTTNEKLHLLKGINGYFLAGKMTALMGSSGAGKTTLMDVLSLRKARGEVSGDIRINGHPQNSNSFRRVTGYVEQFDVQSPQLTVRETVEFSAKMRLDESIPMKTKLIFVDLILAMLELDSIAGFLVGDDTGGLSFEQKKRLSIAVELASNPSIIFLDEPTSGLDARAASVVMRCLRRIADRGVAVVATIHQPSVAIFNSFDSLLLLKSGGETVFFGELGEECCNLIDYFESYPETPIIKGGENPATWMLSTIGAGSAESIANSFDYSKAYAQSPLANDCIYKIKSTTRDATDETQISKSTKFATSTTFQAREVFKRLWKIYFRSPGYNRVRLIVSAIVALLFGSVFASQRVPSNESDMNSRVTSIYITMLLLGVNAMTTVLPVFEMERNMFYRHKASLMYNDNAVALAFTIVEIPFILLAAMVFCLLWYFTVGFAFNASKFFLYWMFTVLSLGFFTFIGQSFMAVFRDTQTAQGFGTLLLSMSSVFAGILIRPQSIKSFWIWAYWILPLHYVLEGLLTSQFEGDQTPIIASYQSPFYDYAINKNCPGVDVDISSPLARCITGTAEEWIKVSFGSMWIPEHMKFDVLYLVGAIVLAKVLTIYGLRHKNFLAK